VRRFLLVLVLTALIVAPAVFLLTSRHDDPPGEGIPLTIAEDRARRVSDLRYDVALDIPESRTSAIEGRLTAAFELADATESLVFDFRQPAQHVHSVDVNGTTVRADIVNGHIVVPAEALVDGHNVVTVTFRAGDAPLNRQDDFLYALFVPARASEALPVMDQPDLKARWTLTLAVPAAWAAVSNGHEAGRVADEDRQTVTFAETEPISTYLFTFATGRFEIEQAERNGRTFRMFHRETDAGKLTRNRDAIFDLHGSALAWLERYTSIPYPFGKFDFVLIPSFQFGGMEHPGAVFYNASSLLLDESATQSQQLGRASLIAHETAHMWFGDLVTMRWFNDVWMKEVFANFMAAKIVNPSFPDVDHELRFLYAHYPAAYGVDRTDGANPIRQELANLNEAGSLYGAIIYQKAPIVMRQLELLIGADAMQSGLREYLRNHAFGNATWPDLVRVLDARTPQDLEAWSRAWVEEPGRPRVTVRRNADGEVVIDTVDSRGRPLEWAQRITPVRLGDTPYLLPNGDGVGYGDFVLEPGAIDYLTTSLHDIQPAVARGAALITLWESMLEGRVAPSRVTEALLTALSQERDQLTIARMLGYLREAYWRFTAPQDRMTLTPRVEDVLDAGLARASTASEKAAWFDAYTAVALTPDALARLERIWRRDEAIPGLTLSEDDEADLALELAVRNVPEAAAILDAQRERIGNPDRKARFTFVMPAASPAAADRAAFFERLTDVANRQREAWVLEGLRYLHHPLRAETSQAFVIPALRMVRDIQRTGDIFFPKRWADATLDGYRTPELADEVRQFIEALPDDYPQRLEWVLLSAADPLFRAAAIQRGER